MRAAASAGSVNYWPDSSCARAFWRQQEIPPYQQLLEATVAWLDPQPGEQWLDLGCGSGQLTKALWRQSQGTLGSIVALDCAAANEKAYQILKATVHPTPPAELIRFVRTDFSAGLPAWGDEHFDGVVSGLAIPYAESYSTEQDCWTTEAYDRVLSEVHRVLKRGGHFIFSVLVPKPSWRRISWHVLLGVFRARRPARYLKHSLRLLRYGVWLTREARRGRFHYLALPVIVSKLTAAGFITIEHRLSYAGQAYLIRCRKPG